MTADKERMSPLTPKDSSLKKRKMSSLSSDHSERTGSSFSERVKDETQLLADLRCWNCRGTPTEVCHVFAKGDYLLEPYLRSRGLLNFDLASSENAIALCPTCRANFDLTSDPGFIFFPSDLHYFIQFEQRDYDKRVQAASRGIQEPRVCPSATAYLEHQKESLLIPDNAAGGLYQRVLLQDYYPLLPKDALSQPKSWHGSPMAAIRRAIMASGTMRLDMFPQQAYLQIRELQQLYSRPDPEPLGKDSKSELTVGFCEVGASLEPPTTDPPKIIEPIHKRSASSAPLTCNYPQRSVSSGWLLGPNQTSQNAIQRYRTLHGRPTT